MRQCLKAGQRVGVPRTVGFCAVVEICRSSEGHGGYFDFSPSTTAHGP